MVSWARPHVTCGPGQGGVRAKAGVDWEVNWGGLGSQLGVDQGHAAAVSRAKSDQNGIEREFTSLYTYITKLTRAKSGLGWTVADWGPGWSGLGLGWG